LILMWLEIVRLCGTDSEAIIWLREDIREIKEHELFVPLAVLNEVFDGGDSLSYLLIWERWIFEGADDVHT
jgi:hypothetical protein